MKNKTKQYFIKIFIILYLLSWAPFTHAAPELPTDIKWLTNNSDPVFSSPEAKKGGTLKLGIQFFPLTFRTVGPDSNSSFRGAILGNQLSLTGIHPNTENIIPEIATHWAFGEDKKTMYFKLNKNAKWSDGVPVTANDFAFTLEFMRSKHIIAPWYNDYYQKEIEKVTVYDDHTLSVTATKAQPDLHLRISLSPTPKHFYGELDENFVKKFNWKISPNTGPYQIADYQKGKFVTFKRKNDWWANDLPYFKKRYNLNKIKYTVIKDVNVEWEYFKKGKIDIYNLTPSKYWHVKAKTPYIENGYIQKIWFYNDIPRSPSGIWLNQDREIFKDKNARYAFAHAINMEKVIEKVLWNDYQRLEQGFLGYGPYSNTTLKAKRFNLEKVNFYLSQSGWKRGTDGVWIKNNKRFSVELTYGSDLHTPYLIVLKEEAKKAGIEIKLQLLDPTAWYNKLAANKHEAIWLSFGTGLRPSYWQHFHSENAHKPQTNNVTNMDNPEIDKLIEQYRNSLDKNERIELSCLIQEKVHHECAFVPAFMIPYVREAYWRWLKLPKIPGTKMSGSLFSPFDSTSGGLFWYDKAIYEETKKAMKSNKNYDPVTITDKTYKTD